jgi:hypothetical protein
VLSIIFFVNIEFLAFMHMRDIVNIEYLAFMHMRDIVYIAYVQEGL